MKLLLTREEVEQIVLEVINQRMNASFNNCSIDTYAYGEKLCTLTIEKADEESA